MKSDYTDAFYNKACLYALHGALKNLGQFFVKEVAGSLLALYESAIASGNILSCDRYRNPLTESLLGQSPKT